MPLGAATSFQMMTLTEFVLNVQFQIVGHVQRRAKPYSFTILFQFTLSCTNIPCYPYPVFFQRTQDKASLFGSCLFDITRSLFEM